MSVACAFSRTGAHAHAARARADAATRTDADERPDAGEHPDPVVFMRGVC
ncbi:MAG: hypothetical protein FWD42_00025 [Solirubrobacterales bacterium]|nr:hypothetical protein [Solirubrobacterales bacterium]